MDAIIPVDSNETQKTSENDSYRLRTDSITKTKSIDENDLRSVDRLEPVGKSGSTADEGFNVHSVYNAFVAALREPSNPKSPIGTQDYINGYRELLK